MSPSRPPTAISLPAPRHAVTADPGYLTARRWAVGVLAAATLAAGTWVGALYVAMVLVRPLVEVLGPESTSSPDLLEMAAAGLPALLVGWCTGLAVLAVLVRGAALGARLTGLTAGALGALAGTLVLSTSSLL